MILALSQNIHLSLAIGVMQVRCLDAHSLKQLYAGCLTLELSIQTVQLWLTEHKLNWTMRLSTYQQQTQRVAMKYFD